MLSLLAATLSNGLKLFQTLDDDHPNPKNQEREMFLRKLASWLPEEMLGVDYKASNGTSSRVESIVAGRYGHRRPTHGPTAAHETKEEGNTEMRLSSRALCGTCLDCQQRA